LPASVASVRQFCHLLACADAAVLRGSGLDAVENGRQAKHIKMIKIVVGMGAAACGGNMPAT